MEQQKAARELTFDEEFAVYMQRSDADAASADVAVLKFVPAAELATGSPPVPEALVGAAAAAGNTQRTQAEKGGGNMESQPKRDWAGDDNDELGIPLPPNWKRAPNNQFYYTDHSTKTTTWTRPKYSTFVQIEVLDSELKQNQWNRVCKTLSDFNGRIFGPSGRYGMSSSGLAYATVDERRINPGVAYITRRPTSLSELSKMNWLKLNSMLVGFVPYSVIRKGEQPDLILPMGLQKLPNGNGSFGEWDAGVMDPKTGKFRTWLPTLVGKIPNVLDTLVQTIIERYPKCVVLTRFASREDRPEKAWNNAGLRKWEKQFPAGHFRLGWRAYTRMEETLDSPDVRVRKTLLQPHVLGPEELKPATYNPRGGGAAIVNDTLIVTDASGKTILQLENISSITPIDRLIGFRGSEFHTLLGCLMCGWT